jgi:tol-pal system protein YbgF
MQLQTGTAARVVGALAAVWLLAGCVTPAEFRKVERRVIDLERERGMTADRGRVADIGSQLDSLGLQIAELQGRLEVAEHRVQEALEEARAARELAGAAAAGGAGPVPDGGGGEGGEEPVTSDEVKRYRDAYAEWRAGNSQACIDQFTKFLQTYPASDYADDATYWLGDCYFKQGNFSAAVLRFDDVARQYPGGNKAADALYRQGEALLRMGHAKAAGNAFEKVLRDYPDSARASEAKRQLDLLGAG